MMQLKMKYIMLTALILAFAGCDKLIYDEKESGNEMKVYLSVNVRAAQVTSRLRATPSINTDVTLYEDKVHHLAMLIFDSSTGDIVGAPYFKNSLGSGESTYAFTAELTAGQTCDFYFVANLPGLKSTLESITTREEMNTFMDTLRDLDHMHYSGANYDNGFPMARVYRNQPIPAGGSIYQPLPFKPKYTQGGTVAILTGSGIETEEPYVMLTRMVAKLELVFSGTDLAIAEVKYHNAFRQYSLVEQNPPIPSPQYHADATLAPAAAGGSTYLYYMPEALLPTSSTWTGAADHKPMNYFSVKTTDGAVYEIPIVSYGIPGTDPDVTPVKPFDDYLKFATGGLTDKPDYNIYRNRHYKFTIKNLQKIEIFYEIDPWVKVSKSLYMGYGYNVEVDGTNITVSNTILACAPHGIVLKTIDPYRFSDGSNEKTFKNGVEADALELTASETYTLNTEPDGGDEYLEVWYNGDLVTTFKK